MTDTLYKPNPLVSIQRVILAFVKATEPAFTDELAEQAIANGTLDPDKLAKVAGGLDQYVTTYTEIRPSFERQMGYMERSHDNYPAFAALRVRGDNISHAFLVGKMKQAIKDGNLVDANSVLKEVMELQAYGHIPAKNLVKEDSSFEKGFGISLAGLRAASGISNFIEATPIRGLFERAPFTGRRPARR